MSQTAPDKLLVASAGLFLLASFSVWSSLELPWLILTIGLAFLWIFLELGVSRVSVCCGLFALLLGAGNVALRVKDPARLPTTELCLSVTVLTPNRQQGFLAELPDGNRLNVKLKSKTDAVKPGDQLWLSGRLEARSPAPAWPRAALEDYWRSQRIVGSIYQAETRKLTRPTNWGSQTLGPLADLQNQLATGLRLTLSSSQYAIVSVLLFSRASEFALPADLAEAGRVLGLSHIFAASGTHFAVLFLFLEFLLAPFLPAKTRIPCLLVLSTLYALLSGWSPSVLRAWILCLFVLAGRLFDKRIKTLNCLALAACFSVLADPYTLGDLGFQFSYLCTLGILLFQEPLAKACTFLPRGLAEPLLLPFTGQLLVLPLQLMHFGGLGLYSLPANLLAVPLSSLILVLALLNASLSAMGSFGLALLALVSFPLAFSLDLLEGLVLGLASLPGAQFQLAPLPAELAFWLYLALVSLTRFPGYFAWHFLAASGLCLGVIYCKPFSNGELRATVLEGTGWRALFVETSQKEKLLFCQPNKNNLSKTAKERLSRKLNSILLANSSGDLALLVGDCPLEGRVKIQRRLTWGAKSLTLGATSIELGDHAFLVNYRAFTLLGNFSQNQILLEQNTSLTLYQQLAVKPKASEEKPEALFTRQAGDFRPFASDGKFFRFLDPKKP